jgi:hypothetical protein
MRTEIIPSRGEIFNRSEAEFPKAKIFPSRNHAVRGSDVENQTILYCDLISNLAVIGTEYQNSVSNNLSKRPAHFLIELIPIYSCKM